MSQTTAFASGPIRYFTSDGKQLLIPLTSITFDQTGAPTLSGSDPSLDTTYNAAVIAYLQQLHQLGRLRAGSTPPPRFGMLVKSIFPGTWGNGTTLVVTYNAAQTHFDLDVTVTQTYEGLTPATLVPILGMTGVLGSRPGLARIRANGSPPAPVGGAPIMPGAGTVSLTGGGAAVSSYASIPVGSSTAFQLEAAKAGASGDKTTVTVSQVTASTFTLSVVWNDKKQNVAIADMSAAITTLNTYFSHVLTVSAPASGPAAAPRAGTTSLGGGVDFGSAQASLISL